MSALEELREKDIETTTAIEDCILQVVKDKSWAFQETARKATAELARLQAIEKAAIEAEKAYPYAPNNEFNSYMYRLAGVLKK